MKLNNERYQWIYDNLDAFKRALVTKDFCESRGLSRLDDKAFHKADDIVHSLALSFLLVAMGDHIPKEMWTVDDILENAPTIDAIPREKWNELKETIIEMRDSDGTAAQNVVCKFLTNLMEILEKEGKNDGFD